MKRLAQVVVLLIAAAAVYFFFFMPKPQTVVQNVNVWVGDEESGCMYPVDQITDGKDPVWWSNNQRRWNQFPSEAEAAAAGYRKCP